MDRRRRAPVTFLAGRAVYDRRAGLLAAGLVAVSLPMIEYSVNGRGYAMMWLALGLPVILTARLIERPALADWAWWVLVAALGMYASPVMDSGLPCRSSGLRCARSSAAGRGACWSWLGRLPQPGWDRCGSTRTC